MAVHRSEGSCGDIPPVLKFNCVNECRVCLAKYLPKFTGPSPFLSEPLNE